MKISVLIASWNTCDLLRKCLQSLFAADSIEVEAIVVDNASSDGSALMIRQEFPQVILVESQENLGFGRASNQAARLATGEIWLLLNTDAMLLPGALPGMLDYLINHPSIGAVGPCLLNPDGSMQVSCSPSPTLWRETWRLFHLDSLVPFSRYPESLLKNRQPHAVDVLLGACILLRREVVTQSNHTTHTLFDEQFFMYSEEVDLCLRIRQAGWQVIWLPEFEVIHYGGQSTRQAADRMFIELYRNKINYFRKHGGGLQARLYKAILFCASLARWIPGTLLGNTPTGRKYHWNNTARQYRKLIGELAHL